MDLAKDMHNGLEELDKDIEATSVVTSSYARVMLHSPTIHWLLVQEFSSRYCFIIIIIIIVIITEVCMLSYAYSHRLH